MGAGKLTMMGPTAGEQRNEGNAFSEVAIYSQGDPY